VKLDRLCTLEIAYSGAFHVVRPYGNESGAGWGRGEGVVSGDRLAGTVEWSNHPSRRGDGTMLPNARGVITTEDGAEVLFELTGRTVFIDREGEEVGRQLVMLLLESEADDYRWLNNTVCICEGRYDPTAAAAHGRFTCPTGTPTAPAGHVRCPVVPAGPSRLGERGGHAV
jgi:hypothetical protein